MSFMMTDISIKCINCGELFVQSMIQRDDEYVRYRCGCGGDIEISDDELIAILFVEKLKIDKPDTYRMLVADMFADYEDSLEYGLDRQLDKIPRVCKHFQCVFDINSTTSEANYKRMIEWKDECPKICPKWRG